MPLLSSQLWCWSWGLRSRACSQQLGSLCHSPASTLPTPIAWLLVLPSIPVRQVHQGYGQILSCQKLSPRLQSRCQTPACTEPSNDPVSDSCQTRHGCSWYPGPGGSREHTCGWALTTGLFIALESRVFSLFDEPEKRGGKIPIILMESSR